MTGRLAGQTAVITGGARGIGAGIGRKFASEGARVIVWDIDIISFNPKVAGLDVLAVEKVDITDEANVADAATRTIAVSGRIDILVNNAGIAGPVTGFADYSIAAWRRVVDVNLTGAFICTKALLPHMLAAGYGRIVNVSSVAGKEGTPDICAYSASKAGLIGLTKSLARETAALGVTVNCIAPVMVATDLMGQLDPDFIALHQVSNPMNRALSIEEIAEMIAFVSSRECGFTTGQIFDLSGGRSSY